ncbi:heterokaryon incompatibility protein-domain-containing protein [Xylariales sp. PMI_506]|nr:heterokaryon incompatibility protein-domain-containing protein [Xylariales sp. PMI_506]
MEKYIYKVLKSSVEPHIRLIELQPDEDIDSQIRISLPTKPLNNLTDYEAISYTWGSDSANVPIICEDKSLGVTTSLWTALKHLRDRKQPRTLWADAVCINQSDLPERGDQVSLMARIYSQASRVLIWLGPDDNKDIENVHASISQVLSLIPEVHAAAEDVQRVTKDMFLNASELQKAGEPNILDHDWRSICCILARPWFTRKWVVQETCLASCALVVCGETQFPWSDLTRLAIKMLSTDAIRLISGDTMLASKHERAFNDSSLVQALQNIQVIALMAQYRQYGSLVDAVVATSKFKCTDPRDHVFALLNIPPRGADLIQPNYQISTAKVFMKFAESILVNQRDLKVLGLAPGDPSPATPFINRPTASGHPLWERDISRNPESMKLPSWVPNLTAQDASTSLCSLSIFSQIWHAGGSHTPQIRISDDKTQLYCKGLVVDTVQELTSTEFRRGEFDRKKRGHLLDLFLGSEMLLRKHLFAYEWLRNSRKFIFPGQEILTKDQWYEFGSIMTCLQIEKRQILAPETVEAFEAYYSHVIAKIDKHGATDPEVERIVAIHGLTIETSLYGVAQDRRLCRTAGKRLAQVPQKTQEGDVFAILLGAEVPFVLRPRRRCDLVSYELIGQAYLTGMMQGEALEGDSYTTEDIIIE